MIILYINNTDRTADLQANTFTKNSQGQQRADDIGFTIFRGIQPTENQEVRAFLGDTVGSIATATITLNGNYQANVGRFYAGQKLTMAIGTSRECTGYVSSYSETVVDNKVTAAQIILTAAPSQTILPDDQIGEIIFGGYTSRVTAVNVQVLQNLEYVVDCVSYDKFFDKALVAGAWSNVDARYIINDFVNTDINYNNTIDTMSYASDGAIQAVWAETGDGSNPTIDSSIYLEETSSGTFPWTFSSGTANWAATFAAADVSDFTGVLTGTPTRGNLMIWLNPTDYTKITNIKIRIGSDSSNYVECTLNAISASGWQYQSVKLAQGVITGTPNWQSLTYAKIIITETASSSIKLNGLRINAEGSFTLHNVNSTVNFTTYQINNIKPTAAMNDLSKWSQYVWDIDYERDIHFSVMGSKVAPFNLSTSSNNFRELQTMVDTSQLGNRIIVNGGLVNSQSTYSQVFQGNNSTREWILYTKYANLSLKINDGTGSHSAEAGTTTTNIKITAHGLATGDHVVNTTRSNAVRLITKVDNDNFTVQTVTGQTNGDTITFFNITKTIGIDSVDDESLFDYMGNYNNQSIRASTQTTTLPSTSFIRASFLEKIPIQTQYQDSASVARLRALGLGNGIFDLQMITDQSIQDTGTAFARAQAQVNQYSNPIIKGKFKTDQHGLQVGQIININDTYRGFNEDVMILTITANQKNGFFQDYFTYNISFGTTLFGLIEFFQKLIRLANSISGTALNAIVELIVNSSEDIAISKTETVQKGGFKSATSASTINVSKSENVYKTDAGTWKYEASIGQVLPSRYDLASYS